MASGKSATKTAARTRATSSSTSGSTSSSTSSFQLSPKSTGSPGPGPSNGGAVDWRKTGAAGEDFDTFGCKVFNENPKTPDWQTANVFFERKFFGNGELVMPDRKRVRHWGFEDPIHGAGQKPIPSPLIRVQEGDLVHVKLEASKRVHTIHHHGIEPTTLNDGVGHVSMEVSGSYIYQWQPRQAGTWFYHCHVNTVLHFEMGLFGLLIVDPKPNANGKIAAFSGGPEYDVEQFWVFDDVDPRWHELNQAAGLCGDDVGLNIFEPRYFLLNGKPTQPKKVAPSGAIKAKAGEKILVRLLNASYSVVKVKIAGLTAHLISVDGHPLNKPWNRPQAYGPREPDRDALFIVTAQRFELLIDTTAAANLGLRGVFPVEITYEHWVSRQPHNAGDRVYEGSTLTSIEIT